LFNGGGCHGRWRVPILRYVLFVGHTRAGERLILTGFSLGARQRNFPEGGENAAGDISKSNCDWPGGRARLLTTGLLGEAHRRRTVFKFFAINCAQSWPAQCAGFPQSGLFMCPLPTVELIIRRWARGLSGPPDGAVFSNIPYKVKDGFDHNSGGRTSPLPGARPTAALDSERASHARDFPSRRMVRPSFAIGGQRFAKTTEHPRPAKAPPVWFYVFRQRGAGGFPWLQVVHRDILLAIRLRFLLRGRGPWEQPASG